MMFCCRSRVGFGRACAISERRHRAVGAIRDGLQRQHRAVLLRFWAYRAVSVPSQAYRAVRRRLTLFFIAGSQKGGLDFLWTNGSDAAPTISVSVFAGPQREPFA